MNRIIYLANGITDRSVEKILKTIKNQNKAIRDISLCAVLMGFYAWKKCSDNRKLKKRIADLEKESEDNKEQ